MREGIPTRPMSEDNAPDVAAIAREAARLTEQQHNTILLAEVLDDGRVLVPAYLVPDHLTRPYSVHRSALNRLGLALRNHLMEKNDVQG